MSYNFCDEYGRPYILIREQDTRKRGEEKDILGDNVKAFTEIVDCLSTSVGPFGADKAIVGQDGEVLITNDGATILKEMDLEGTPMGKLITQLSTSQDDEIGDGTTSVVLIAAALLEEAATLASKGMHPLKIIRGYEEALDVALVHIEKKTRVYTPGEIRAAMESVARSTLSSKIVSRDISHYIDIAIQAVELVEDSRGEANLELIKIEGETKAGQTELIRGVYLSKEFSHFQMPKHIPDARIAILACPFEPPKIKIKHDLNIQSVEEFNELSQYEKKVFAEMIESIKASKANVVFCQWGFDDEANSLLMQAGISAVRWVGAQELEMLSIHTGAEIISRFEDLSPKSIGRASVTEHNNSIRIQNPEAFKTATIIIRGGTQTIIEETKRSIRDVLCAIRNIRKDPKAVQGAGKIDIECSQAILSQLPGTIAQSYAKALLKLPMALAKNQGNDPIESLSGSLTEEPVWEGAHSKKHQLTVATQTAKSIIRIDEVFNSA
ncbi:T-complex protein 1 subunit epsilon [Nematocida sp. AWRm80]|nr:T-complex protein 1 subunit epsilon [Nematocida sp. AWRm80]